MTHALLFDEKAVKARIYKVYSGMKHSAKPKLWKNGRMKGKIRVSGLTVLPFTAEQLWQYALAAIGTGVIRCPYCVEIGRPANLIDLTNCVFDHVVPKNHAGAELSLGEVWSLPNIRVCCADCNNLKGKLSFAFFIGIMAAIDKWEDPRDRDSIFACLRTHGHTLRNFGDKKKPPLDDDFDGEPIPTTGKLALKAPPADW